MLLNKLSISYKCSNAIGNSLNLKGMISEFIKIFVKETHAVYGSFYLSKDKDNKEIVSIGKSKYFNNCGIDCGNIVKIENIEDDKLKLLSFPLNDGTIYLIYYAKEDLDLDFINSILLGLKNKIDIAISSCLNVEKLELEKKRYKLLSDSLQIKVDEAIVMNNEKQKILEEKSKMAQIGEMIGNIAHQWRQPLSVISTAASGMSIKKDVGILEDNEFFSLTEEIMKNAMYLSSTLDEFRDYINYSHEKVDVILQDRLKLAVDLTVETYKSCNISLIENRVQEEKIHYKIVPGDLLQVIVSVLKNAQEVLCEKIIDGDRWVKYSLYEKDKNIVIEIEDNGGGISEEISKKIFNPYFTTKHKAKGTGIGLYSCYNIIVNQLDGKFYFKNTKEGVIFFIELPSQ